MRLFKTNENEAKDSPHLVIMRLKCLIARRTTLDEAQGLGWYIPGLSDFPLEHRPRPLLAKRSSFSLILLSLFFLIFQLFLELSTISFNLFVFCLVIGFGFFFFIFIGFHVHLTKKSTKES